MLTRVTRLGACGLAVAVMLSVSAGCKKETPAESPATAKPAPAAKPAAEAKPDSKTPGVEALSAALTIDAESLPDALATLAAADGFDGAEDKVVERCASCALHMNGSKEHAAKVSGYMLYFCTEACKDRFTKDVTQSILALEIPDEEQPMDMPEEDEEME